MQLQQVLLSSKNLSRVRWSKLPKHKQEVAKQKRKLGPKWVGPFTVVEMIGKVAVQLELPDG